MKKITINWLTTHDFLFDKHNVFEQLKKTQGQEAQSDLIFNFL
jgi:hypothetical protein